MVVNYCVVAGVELWSSAGEAKSLNHSASIFTVIFIMNKITKFQGITAAPTQNVRAILQNQQLAAATMLKYLQRAEKKLDSFSIVL